MDVGGTFTDLFLEHDADGRQFRVQHPFDPRRPVPRECPVGVQRPSARRRGSAPASGAKILDMVPPLRSPPTPRSGSPRASASASSRPRASRRSWTSPCSQTPGPSWPGGSSCSSPTRTPPLEDTREVAERMDARGDTIVPVDQVQVERVVRDLVESGVEAINLEVVVLLSTSPPPRAPDRRCHRAADPGFPVTLSSDAVPPEFREYERTLTAARTPTSARTRGGDCTCGSRGHAAGPRRPRGRQHPASRPGAS